MRVSKQDLRLGNIFEQGIVCKINGRTGAKVHVYGKLKWKNGLKVIESVAVEDLKPIPLSSQVLVDWCGYEQLTKNHFLAPRDKLFIYIHLKGNFEDGYMIAWCDGLLSGTVKYKYLHELQNLFYIFNKQELEIKE